MKRVFLGGTCNESAWRNRMMIHLHEEGVEWFNPVVPDWTEVCMEREIKEREICDFVLYAITPKTTGVYSIAEVIDDSNKRPGKTILFLLRADGNLRFSEEQWKSLGAVAIMVARNGGKVFDNLKAAAVYIGNSHQGDRVKCELLDPQIKGFQATQKVGVYKNLDRLRGVRDD